MRSSSPSRMRGTSCCARRIRCGWRRSPPSAGSSIATRPGWDAALLEPTCTDIDVAGLHAFYLAAARRAGAVLLTDATLRAARREDGFWRLDTAAGRVEAALLVDAAGAWADAVARLAGV